MKIQKLENLASELVGDGKTPNLYFVSNKQGHIIAIFVHKEGARNYWVGGYRIEDRLDGEIWDGVS